jgi:hypothetical protein
MNALETISLVLAAGLVGGACGDDDDKTATKLDAGVDSGIVISDGGGGSDAGARPCTSYTPVANGKCGGSHCTQTESELKATAVANATCGGEVEIRSFCSLEAVNVVAQCTRNSLGSIGDDATFSNSITACATTPSAQNMTVVPTGFSSTCLNCFVDSAKCAAKNCLVECAANDKTPQCDECRINKGCIGSFYQCAGITNPLDLLAAAQDAGLIAR